MVGDADTFVTVYSGVQTAHCNGGFSRHTIFIKHLFRFFHKRLPAVIGCDKFSKGLFDRIIAGNIIVKDRSICFNRNTKQKDRFVAGQCICHVGHDGHHQYAQREHHCDNRKLLRCAENVIESHKDRCRELGATQMYHASFPETFSRLTAAHCINWRHFIDSSCTAVAE